MSHKVWIQRHELGGCPGRRVIEVGDRGELVAVVKVDYELPAGRTLEDVRDSYAKIHGLAVVKP